MGIIYHKGVPYASGTINEETPYGTSAPSGGSDGDLYIQIDNNGNIVKVWQNHNNTWGYLSGGETYTAGTNISIDNNVISAIDTNEVSGLNDVEITNLDDGQVLKWDGTNEKWVNDDEAGGLTPVEMDYEDWLALPQEEREDPNIEYFLSNAPGGGRGGDISKVDILWTASTVAGERSNITLEHEYTDYDYLVFVILHGTGTSARYMNNFIAVETLEGLRTDELPGYLTITEWDNGYINYEITSKTLLTYKDYASAVNSNMYQVIGMKLGGGGGSEVIPNPQDTATDTLSTVEIDGTIYELSGEEYEAGENINITNNVISATDTTYTAGTNIQINAQNEISAHENMAGETIPTSSEGNNNAIYIQYSTTGGETDYETIWTGSISTSAWASPVQIGTINPSEYYRIKITGTGNGERLVSEIPVVGSGDLWHLGHEMYIFTANDCTELWLYSSTGYANTVTKVEATTYDEKMVDSIEKVYGKIKDDWYEIATGGGTNIVPNPQGTATDTLNTVSIDGTIFDIPSSSSGLNVTVTKILDQHIETTGNFAIDDSIDNYDALLIGGYNYVSSSYSNQYKTTLILKEDYYKNTSNHADHILGNMTASTSGDNPRRVIFYFPDDTHINIQTRNFASIDKIFGLKFEQGGSSEINYSTEEQMIGTYMGQPLYRKVIDEINISTSSTWSNIANITGGKDLVDLKVWGYFDEYFLIAYSQAHINSATGTLEVKFNVGDTRTIKRIAVDYTKTTD